MVSSRVSRTAVLFTAVAALSASLLTATTAQADNPTADELQAQLTQSRVELNSLYARAAAASERVNGATVQLEQTEAQLEENRAALQRAERAHEEQRAVVAAFTVEQQLNGSGTRILESVMEGTDPAVVLEEASSLNAVREALTAELDHLDASQTVVTAATHAVEQNVADQQDALADRQRARDQITDAIAQAEALQRTMTAERDGLLRQLARAQDRPLEQVIQEQDAIDEQIDSSGPGTTPDPPRDDDPTPDPTPQPTTPSPTTPPPPEPPPTPDPPPASGSKVEKAIAYARAQLGEPYAWGGAGPSKWDCSGLTMRAWQAAGVNLSHHAAAQYRATKSVSVNSMRRGDLLYWSNGSASSIYHVAMYLGDGTMIHAPRPGRSVEIVSVNYWIKPDLASRPG